MRASRPCAIARSSRYARATTRSIDSCARLGNSADPNVVFGLRSPIHRMKRPRAVRLCHRYRPQTYGAGDSMDRRHSLIPTEEPMLNFLKSGALTLALAAGFAACKGGSDAVDPRLRRSGMSADLSDAATTTPSTKSVLLGRATFLPFAGTPDDNKFDIKRRTDDWDIDI